jgi:hypothetical protein
LPFFEPTLAEEGKARVSLALRECNYMQALEGDIDTSHLAFLHLGASDYEDMPAGSFNYYLLKNRSPQYIVLDTEFGTSYGAYRPAEEDTYYWRIAHFLFPFYTMIPSGKLGEQILVRAWVPLDDENTMYWGIATQFVADSGGIRGQPQGQRPPGSGMLPNTTDWLGRFRLEAHAGNDYYIDREKQSAGVSYTGLSNVPLEDQAITESMGAVYNRSQEHFGTSDAMIIRTRRRLINAAKALREEGSPPPGVHNPEVYLTRSGGILLPRSADWLQATEHLRTVQVDREALKTAAKA